MLINTPHPGSSLSSSPMPARHQTRKQTGRVGSLQVGTTISATAIPPFQPAPYNGPESNYSSTSSAQATSVLASASPPHGIPPGRFYSNSFSAAPVPGFSPDAHYSLPDAPIPGFPLDTHYSPPDAAAPVTAPAFSPSGFPPGDSYSLPDGATSVPMSAAVSVPMPMSTFPLSGPNISSQGSGALEEQTQAAINMIQVSYHLYNGLNY